MSWFEKLKSDLAYNLVHNTLAWKALKLSLLILFSVSIYVGYTRSRDAGPWYLGCATADGKELLLQTDKKPRVEGSLVFLEEDIFLTPLPGMTCRIVTVRKVEEEHNSRKALDNQI